MRETEADGQVRLDLDVDGELWRSFEEEATQQEVSIDRLAEHAVLYLAAEIDAGRIVLRMLDQIESVEVEDQGA
ncbi:MAG: hypothetical protein WD810_07060 [Solirubrobacterales bacterium]